jgi:hypothetical protein
MKRVLQINAARQKRLEINQLEKSDFNGTMQKCSKLSARLEPNNE